MKNTARMLTLISGLFGVTAALAVEPINTKGRDRLAARGYDVVAYFQGEARRGSDAVSHRWMDATWRFSSAANRDLFAADPERYAPRFGGYCAWAVSRGYTADVDPEAWTVYENKLYLNYSKSVRTRWSEDVPGNVARGEENWPRLLAEGKE